jgi:integrase
LRQEEICQLQVSDIKCEQGIWYFDVNDEPPRKLKNRTAVRLVPIHSELVRIGFLGHVEEQRKNNQVRVFSGLKAGGADGRLAMASRSGFRATARKMVSIGPDSISIPFRHSTTTFLHRAGVTDSVIDRVTGHATPGETSRYTKGKAAPASDRGYRPREAEARVSSNPSGAASVSPTGTRYGLMPDIVSALTGHHRKTGADSYGEFPMRRSIGSCRRLDPFILVIDGFLFGR